MDKFLSTFSSTGAGGGRNPGAGGRGPTYGGGGRNPGPGGGPMRNQGPGARARAAARGTPMTDRVRAVARAAAAGVRPPGRGEFGAGRLGAALRRNVGAR